MKRFFVKNGMYVDVQEFFENFYECQFLMYVGNGEYKNAGQKMLLTKAQIKQFVPGFPEY
jgi:hypothetical protein